MPLHSLQHLIQKIEHKDAWKTHRQFQRILAQWSVIVGDAVAARTRPLGIQKNVLRVVVCNSIWAQNLAFERQRILQKLNTQFPGISLTDIRFSTTQWHSTKRQSDSIDDNADVLEVWRSHPSRIPDWNDNSSPKHLSIVPNRPEEAFDRWSQAIQKRSAHLPTCPTCHCPTPEGELRRWKMCGLCATHHWTKSSPTISQNQS